MSCEHLPGSLQHQGAALSINCALKICKKNEAAECGTWAVGTLFSPRGGAWLALGCRLSQILEVPDPDLNLRVVAGGGCPAPPLAPVKTCAREHEWGEGFRLNFCVFKIHLLHWKSPFPGPHLFY